MANAYFYSNIAVPTTLSGNINNSVTTCTVADTTGWPGTTPYIVALDYGTANEELVKVTANAAGTLTIQRAYGGTTAVSHSTGATVRHVYNAQDATDFRTHEQATSGAHGIAGSFVGTTDVQTLTNKTLTAPSITNAAMSGGGSMAGTFSGTPTFSGAVVLSGTPSINNGAALTGTFTGSPTFSGSPVFSGTPNFTGVLQSTQSLSTNVAIGAIVSADTFDRFRIYGSGLHEWGSGALARDTNLYRNAANELKTDDAFTAVGTFTSAPTSTSVDAFAANLPTSTTGDLLNLRVNSAIQAAMDSTGMFRIYGGNAPTSYVPVVSGGGTATFTTNAGYYWRLGKMVYFSVYVVVNAAGSGAGTVSITAPSNIDRTTRQEVHCHTESMTTGNNGSSTLLSFTSGSTNVWDRIRNSTNGSITGADLLAGSIITVNGWYREA